VIVRPAGPPAAPSLPAALSPLSAELVWGPPRPARVVAVFDRAAYLLVEAGERVTRLVPLLAPGALLLPTGVRLARPPDGGWAVAVGTIVRVGEGRIVLPKATVRVVRAWHPARVREATGRRPGPAIAALLSTAALPPALVSATRRVVARALAAEPDPGWEDLIGAGPGLTPSGDDALCAALLALHAWGRPAPADGLEDAYPHTTALSAALLDAARSGFAVPEVARLLDAVLADDTSAAAAAMPGVLAIGHSSGRDLVAGLLGAVGAVRDVGARARAPEPVVPRPRR
jgi:hypothetical protein